MINQNARKIMDLDGKLWLFENPDRYTEQAFDKDKVVGRLTYLKTEIGDEFCMPFVIDGMYFGSLRFLRLL